MFNNVNRLNHSSPMNNTLNKIKDFPQLFALGLQIPITQKWHHFLALPAINTKLDMWVKYNDVDICKGLLQPIFGHNKTLDWIFA